jgi:hypothetical protein
MRIAYALVIATAASAAACASLPAPVALQADPEGQRLLAGQWDGEYENPATGRAGSITFSLVQHDTAICNVHAEHAHGDVLMVPRGSSEPLPPSEGWNEGRPEQTPSVLGIELIRVTGDQLTGMLQPYRDPVSGHSISATFDGTIRGNVISGEFVSVDGKTGERMIGTWQVTRRVEKEAGAT